MGARLGGFDGIGIRPEHLDAAVELGLTVPLMRRMLEDQGVVVTELGLIRDWWADGPRQEDSRRREDEIYRLHDALGGRHVTVTAGELVGPLERTAERLAALGDRAAAHGLAVALEFLPWVDLRSVREACNLVRMCARTNVGLILDTWHFFRGPNVLEDLAFLSPEHVIAVQLSDGPMAVADSEREDTYNWRRLPGEGEFDLVGFFAHLGSLGIDAPIGVEIISKEFRSMHPLVAAERAGQTTERWMRRSTDLRR